MRTYNAVVSGVSFDDFELDGSHASTDQEKVSLADGSVSLQEVRLEVDLKQVSGNALNRVVDREDMNALSVFDISACMKGNDVSETDTKVLANNCGMRRNQ